MGTKTKEPVVSEARFALALDHQILDKEFQQTEHYISCAQLLSIVIYCAHKSTLIGILKHPH